MSRDYARKNRRTSKPLWQSNYQKKSSIRKKVSWLALLLLMVILPVFIFSLSTIKKHSPVKTASRHVAIKVTKPEMIPLAKTEPVHFEFYNILPKITVDTPKKQVSQLEKHRNYIVQIASLKDLNDAKAFRKKLKKMGFNAEIHLLQRNQTKWYRIQIGPFDNKDFAQEIHGQLQERNVSSIIVSV